MFYVCAWSFIIYYTCYSLKIYYAAFFKDSAHTVSLNYKYEPMSNDLYIEMDKNFEFCIYVVLNAISVLLYFIRACVLFNHYRFIPNYICTG